MMKAYCVSSKGIEVIDSAVCSMLAEDLEGRFPEGIVYRWENSVADAGTNWRILQRSAPHPSDSRAYYYATLLPLADHAVPNEVRLAHLVS